MGRPKCRDFDNLQLPQWQSCGTCGFLGEAWNVGATTATGERKPILPFTLLTVHSFEKSSYLSFKHQLNNSVAVFTLSYQNTLLV